MRTVTTKIDNLYILMDRTIQLNPNEVVSFLGKQPKDFTRGDMLHFIEGNGIRMIDFMYPAEDGRDDSLREEVSADPSLLEKLVGEYFYCG